MIASKLDEIHFIPSEVDKFIQAQARVAFSKSNRAAGLEVEDFVSIGYEVYWKALKTWDETKSTKFNTYLTLCLQRCFYKVNSKTMRKKRGGAGNKAEDFRFGRQYRWKDGAVPESFKHISISVSTEEHETADLQIESPENNAAEYEMLIEQVGKTMPYEDFRVYKQMVDPDPELLEIAAESVKGESNRKCTISTEMMAAYLHMSRADLAAAKNRVKEHVAKQMNYVHK